MSTAAPCYGVDAIRNFFERSQHKLIDLFDELNPALPGIWEGKLNNLGQFPLASGWAARTTTLGFKALQFSDIAFNPMTGLQSDCSGSCDVPATQLNLGASNNEWYRMTEAAYNSEVFCLVKMAGDALNLPEQLSQIVRNLKLNTNQVHDEFSRRAFFTTAAHRWAALDGTTSPDEGLWSFRTDANGFSDVNYIELDAAVSSAADVALPNVDALNFVIQNGTYWGAFAPQGGATLISDIETATTLPKFDTNVRADNRFREPGSLNPGFNTIHKYANIDFMNDPFGLRYNYTEDDPLYPGGVLKRVEPWTSQSVTGGCWSKVSNDYLRADFQLSGFWNPRVVGLQTFSLNGNLPGGTYAQPQAPYDGMWRFVNGINPITPSNLDQTKAFWRMVYRMAAKPISSGEMGHVVLHRRFGGSGNVKSCRTLASYPSGSYACDETCVPLDWEPPTLSDPQVCGTWNADAITACCQPE